MVSYSDTMSEVLAQYQRATSLPSIPTVTRDKITATYGLPAGFGKGMTDATISSDAAAAVLKKFVADQAAAKPQTEPPPAGETPPGGGSSASWDPTRISWPANWPAYATVSQQAAQEYAANITANYSPGGVFYGQGAVADPYAMPPIPPEVATWDPTRISWPSSWPDYAKVSLQAAKEYAASIRMNYSPGGVFYGQGAAGNPYAMPYIPPEVG